MAQYSLWQNFCEYWGGHLVLCAFIYPMNKDEPLSQWCCPLASGKDTAWCEVIVMIV